MTKNSPPEIRTPDLLKNKGNSFTSTQNWQKPLFGGWGEGRGGVKLLGEGGNHFPPLRQKYALGGVYCMTPKPIPPYVRNHTNVNHSAKYQKTDDTIWVKRSHQSPYHKLKKI